MSSLEREEYMAKPRGYESLIEALYMYYVHTERKFVLVLQPKRKSIYN